MTDSPQTDPTGRAARIAELEAAIRYWEGEAAKSPAERLPLVEDNLGECRSRLAALRGDGMTDAAC